MPSSTARNADTSRIQRISDARQTTRSELQTASTFGMIFAAKR
jgi:hypothetical protein